MFPTRGLVAEKDEFGDGVDKVLAIGDFGQGGSRKVSGAKGDVAKVVSRLEERFPRKSLSNKWARC